MRCVHTQYMLYFRGIHGCLAEIHLLHLITTRTGALSKQTQCKQFTNSSARNRYRSRDPTGVH
jgi:hypothetical protein